MPRYNDNRDKVVSVQVLGELKIATDVQTGITAGTTTSVFTVPTGKKWIIKGVYLGIGTATTNNDVISYSIKDGTNRVILHSETLAGALYSCGVFVPPIDITVPHGFTFEAAFAHAATETWYINLAYIEQDE